MHIRLSGESGAIFRQWHFERSFKVNSGRIAIVVHNSGQ